MNPPSPPASLLSIAMAAALDLRLGTFLHQNIGGRGKVAGPLRHQPYRIGRHLVAFAIDRQAHGNPRALTQPAADIDIAAMQLYQALDDRKAETGPVVAAIISAARLEKRFAKPRQIGFADADTGIFNGNIDLIAVTMRTDRHASTPRRELDGV